MKAGAVEQRSWARQCRSINQQWRQDGSPVWVCDSWWRCGYWVARWVSLAWAWAWAVASRLHGMMGLSLSLSRSRLFLSFLLFYFSFFPSFLAFPFGFAVLLTARSSSSSSSSFYFYFYLFIFYIYIYIFKVFMGSWKLLGWLAGIGMVEVRGARAKNQGGPSLFLKILHTIFFFF